MTEAGNWPAGTKAVANWFPQERRAFAMAMFDGGSAVGAVPAPPLVALLALKFAGSIIHGEVHGRAENASGIFD